jgi:hypothetical protein
MKNHRACFVLAISTFVITSAHAQLSESAPTKYSNHATSSTGTILKQGRTTKDIKWESEIPLNRTYGKLTPDQRAELHAMYSSLSPGDEPPFPEKGLKAIFTAIRLAQRQHQAVGELDMSVTVGPDGVPIKVENHGTVNNAKMTGVATDALMSTKYKPAKCDGTPCTMEFRFTQKLKSAS